MDCVIQRLQQADTSRRSGAWKQALDHYAYVEAQRNNDAALKSNIALCYLGLKDSDRAIAYCDAAIRLNANAWQAMMVKAKALRMRGDADGALTLLAAAMKRQPAAADARLELASLALDELGDAALTKELVKPLLRDAAYRVDATLTMLMARLYERNQPADALSRDIRAFSAAALALPPLSLPLKSCANGKKRVSRVGLISPMFCCSPVYFFCIGALKILGKSVELVILNRGRRSDWATKEFATIGKEWHDVAGLNSEALAIFIAGQGLDALIDLGGWTDVEALRAIAAKPAPRILKWVGGQAATTGVSAFDGMISDEGQTPASHQRLYAEPLILLENGYVTYTPPPYMPEPVAPPAHASILGVISNPVKVSGAFLSDLRLRAAELADVTGKPVTLRFIDRRYRHKLLRSRILRALDDRALRDGTSAIGIEFVHPASHRDYLSEIARLSAVMDTFPYSGGLTTMEALSLGVPCLTRAGELFSGRHSYAHCMYAGLDPGDFELDRNGRGIPDNIFRPRRAALLGKGSKRLNHEALAIDLLRLIESRRL